MRARTGQRETPFAAFTRDAREACDQARGDSMRQTPSIAAWTSRCGSAYESVERVPGDMFGTHHNIFFVSRNAAIYSDRAGGRR
jgi:hypothetical protein